MYFKLVFLSIVNKDSKLTDPDADTETDGSVTYPRR